MKKITLSHFFTLAIAFIGISTMAQTNFYIDFNQNTSAQYVTPGNWNNYHDAAVGTLTDIISDAGVASTIDMAITDPFVSANGTGTTTPAGTLPFPATATSDSFYVQDGANNTGAITISSLDPTKTYSFLIFASRAGVSDTRIAVYNIVGATSGSATLDASNNTANTCSINGIQPTAGGQIVINVSKDPSSTGIYAYIGCMKLTETIPVAPQVLLDAEDGTTNKLTLNVMGGVTNSNTDMTVVDNPNPSGINTSSKVVKFERNTAGDPWGGFWSPVVDPDPDFTINKYVHVKVLKTRISPIKFKIEGGAAGNLEIASVNAQTQTGVWEDFVFDFSSKTGTYPTVVFMPDYFDPQVNEGNITIYFDDIIVNNIATPTMGITDNYLVGKISIFPNPSNGLLTVESLEEIQSVSIFSLDGRQVANYNNMSVGITQINIENLSKGMYFMNFVAPNGATFTHKLIKE
jgi:hypothetical protein